MCITCGVYGQGDVTPVAVNLARLTLTGALVHVAADLRVRLVASASGTRTREATRCVAALTASAELKTEFSTVLHEFKQGCKIRTKAYGKKKLKSNVMVSNPNRAPMVFSLEKCFKVFSKSEDKHREETSMS